MSQYFSRIELAIFRYCVEAVVSLYQKTRGIVDEKKNHPALFMLTDPVGEHVRHFFAPHSDIRQMLFVQQTAYKIRAKEKIRLMVENPELVRSSQAAKPGALRFPNNRLASAEGYHDDGMEAILAMAVYFANWVDESFVDSVIEDIWSPNVKPLFVLCKNKIDKKAMVASVNHV